MKMWIKAITITIIEEFMNNGWVEYCFAAISIAVLLIIPVCICMVIAPAREKGICMMYIVLNVMFWVYGVVIFICKINQNRNYLLTEKKGITNE